MLENGKLAVPMNCPDERVLLKEFDIFSMEEATFNKVTEFSNTFSLVALQKLMLQMQPFFAPTGKWYFASLGLSDCARFFRAEKVSVRCRVISKRFSKAIIRIDGDVLGEFICIYRDETTSE
ncbi:MAG: hypothetical protein IPJ84_03205 [Bdellovibrionales bacterium]|nr:hypothetical protein [Bdellovibrionales bacterium]